MPASWSDLIATLSLVPPTGFALHGESLSLVWPRESNQREGHPGIRVWPPARLPSLRRCSGGRLTRAILGPLCGAPSPLAASMRLAPLCNTSTRPPDGERRPSRPRVLGLFISSVQTGRRHQPPLQEGEWNRRGRG
ncbi:hypothetical protein CXK93_12020 [Stutzerimonas decontaminans]|uniref:Uncharacterized protein n=1 Tax=Stutzerimonas decontaminans TaxID=3022791 RepID=A0ABX4VXQ6_9GAMM|nr:hypothetical protein CXK93_12020 [Stutzerimonas decontaminans]